MFRKVQKSKLVSFNCPFCKKNIPISVKTEICYRSNWIDGCSECYIKSIEKATYSNFQTELIPDLL